MMMMVVMMVPSGRMGSSIVIWRNRRQPAAAWIPRTHADVDDGAPIGRRFLTSGPNGLSSAAMPWEDLALRGRPIRR